MFGWIRKLMGPKGPQLRDQLFGDLPLDQWILHADQSQITPPWDHFIALQDLLKKNDLEGAEAEITKILEMPDLDTRHYLQAWHALRTNVKKFPEPEVENILYGVVFEVAIPQGVDYLGAYTDGTARYINYSGSVIAWDQLDEEIQNLVLKIIGKSSLLVESTNLATKPHTTPPSKGITRIHFLTAGGARVTENATEALSQDEQLGSIFGSATSLISELVERSHQALLQQAPEQEAAPSSEEVPTEESTSELAEAPQDDATPVSEESPSEEQASEESVEATSSEENKPSA